jgi:copper chaperone CopZ
MTNVSPYLHALDGRIRIKTAAVKDSPAKATEVEQALRQRDGITSVKANPMTGNVLILFEPARIHQEQVLEALRGAGYLSGGPSSPKPVETRSLGTAIAKFCFQSLADMAVQRLILELI